MGVQTRGSRKEAGWGVPLRPCRAHPRWGRAGGPRMRRVGRDRCTGRGETPGPLMAQGRSPGTCPASIPSRSHREMRGKRDAQRSITPPPPTDPPRDLPQVICPRAPGAILPLALVRSLWSPERGAQQPHSICRASGLSGRPAQTQGLHLHPHDVKPGEKPQTHLPSPQAYGPQKQKPVGGRWQDPRARLQKAETVLYLCGQTKASRPQDL